ncbi:arsenate reductase ArsC [Blastopirellula marina]|uniref:Low molecular weight phosphatase family protein n=1 Tax=Blastopirellula marina TaxID=124 RepID=A0A2S8GHW6_9BACT|nr:arsenate reductase ArsC [Blastopirellula marina]PQO44035.1 low molecular weight phosphatase family protein [Blastopirellula marina]
MKRVLVLCTGNSCRSQMAEALFETLSQGEWQAESAGSKPSGYVHPLAIRAMSELGVDIGANQSKHVDLFADQPFDLVVTVCDNAKEACPVFPGAKLTLHWPFDDPADATGDEEEKMVMFRRVRDEIKTKIAEYLPTA